MLLRSMAAALVVLAATTVWGQSASPSTASRPGAVMATSNAESNAAALRAQAAMHQRVQEMGSTLTKMHALLKQMRTKAAASGSKDAMAKANLDMWELMVGQLDKQFEELERATRTRADLEARRAAMYKQAEMKAALEAQRAQASGAAQAPAAGAGQGAATGAASQGASAPPAVEPPPASPVASSPSPN